MTLKDAANHLKDWYISALNRAAARHNINYLPETIGSEEWKFAAESIDKPSNIKNYPQAFEEYFKKLHNIFYQDSKETGKETFLESFYESIINSYNGYKGIYDNFEYHIKKLLIKI
jgi:hypothetical protein